MEVFARTSRDDDHAYLWHSGGHFNAVIWDDRYTVSRPSTPSRPHSGAPRNARAQVRISRALTNTVAGSQLLGVLTWNINHLGSQAHQKLTAALYKLQPRNERKLIYNDTQTTGMAGHGSQATPAHDTAKKLRALEQIIDENCSWLDIIALQEVNRGIEYLATTTIGRGKSPLHGLRGDKLYTCHRGPHLHSVGGSGVSGRGQQEYYPILIPKERPGALRPMLGYLGWSAVFASGHIDDGTDDTSTKLRWVKRSVYENADPKQQKVMRDLAGPRTYRPVVVHRLRADGQRVNIAIVHTTPGGTELERADVYFQVEEFFHMVTRGDLDRASTGERPDLWIITGDFYLFGEAAAFRNTRKTRLANRADTDLTMAQRLGAYLAATTEAYTKLAGRITELPERDESNGTPEQRAAKRQRRDSRRPTQLILEHCLNNRQADSLYLDRAALGAYRKALEDAAQEMQTLLRKLNEGDSPSDALKRVFSLERQLVQAAQPRRDGAKKTASSEDEENEAHGEDNDDEAEDKDEDEDEDEDRGEGGREKEREDDGKSRGERSHQDDDPDDETETTDEADENVSGHAYWERAKKQGRDPFYRLRNVLGYSVAERLRDHFTIVQAPAGTNIHASANIKKADRHEGITGQDESIEYSAFRIADFFVIDRRWLSLEAGLLVDDDDGGLVWVDTEDAEITKRWRSLSDHFPMGLRVSTAPHDTRVENALRPEKRAVRKVAALYERIAELGGQAELQEIASSATHKREPNPEKQIEMLTALRDKLSQTKFADTGEPAQQERSGVVATAPAEPVDLTETGDLEDLLP